MAPAAFLTVNKQSRFLFLLILLMWALRGWAGPGEGCADELRTPQRRVIVDSFRGRPLEYFKVETERERKNSAYVVYRTEEVLRPDELAVGVSENGHSYLLFDGWRIDSIAEPRFRMKMLALRPRRIEPGYLFVIKSPAIDFNARFCDILAQAEANQRIWLTTCAHITGSNLQALGFQMPWVSFRPQKLAEYFFELKQNDPSSVDIIKLANARPENFLNELNRNNGEWAKRMLGL